MASGGRKNNTRCIRIDDMISQSPQRTVWEESVYRLYCTNYMIQYYKRFEHRERAHIVQTVAEGLMRLMVVIVT